MEATLMASNACHIYCLVTLAGMVNPGVTVAIYNIVGDNGGSADIVAIEAREVGTTDYTVLLSSTRSAMRGCR